MSGWWFWYRQDGVWRIARRHAPAPRYSRPCDWLASAEAMMRGDHADILWRKAEAAAGKLVWC